MDVGAGDGRHVIALARARPDVFAVAIEPSTDALRDAARSLTRRPLRNAALIATAVERCVLPGFAHEVTVSFPWGTLLDAVLGANVGALCALAAIARPGATLRVLTSLVERDGRGSLPTLRSLAAAYDEAGFEGLAMRPATRADVDDAHSSWGKRLGAGQARPAFVLSAVRR